MKIGYCIGINEMKKLDACGLDYFETGLSTIAAMSEKEFYEAKSLIETLKTPVSVCNVLLPGSQKVVGPNYDVESCRNYLKLALSRAKQLGVKLIVFGSGAAKVIPEGFDRDKAMMQLVEFTRLLADTAEKYDILITIEALRREECNCINSLSESEWLCDQVHSDHVAVLADWYHMSESGDTPARMKALGKKLRHVHMAQPKTREVSFAEDGSDYTEFFTALAELGYDGGISAEGHAADVPEGCRKFIEFVRLNQR